jgi:hypothetical protein
MNGSSCGKKGNERVFFCFSDLVRGTWGARGKEYGVRALGKQRVAGGVAYLLRSRGLHDADRMADERGRCPRKTVSIQEMGLGKRDVPMPRLR